jgi:hypothetical protein
MEPKYVEAIKAGIIGGVILAIVQLISDLMSLLNVIKVDYSSYEYGATPTLSGELGLAALFGCCICALYIVVLVATGAMAVRMNRGLLRDLNDAVINAALAGAVAGLIWGAVSVILGVLRQLINPDSAAGRLGGSLISGICGVLCCLPAEIVIGAIIALIGGALYYALAGKNE